jgi:hypothetical protein
VALSGSYAYVADGSAGLRVIDVSTPTNPSEVGFFDVPRLAASAQGVAVSRGYAYVANSHDGLLVIDVSDPFSPVGVGHKNTPQGANGVTVAGGYVYLAESSAGMEIFQICGGDIFADGFESGDCSIWSREVP